MNKIIKTIMLSMLIAVYLTCTGTVNVNAAFDDINASPYKAAIEQLAELKITAGKSASEFGVNDNVTRQQMTLFMARLLTGNEINGFENAANDTTFTDITDPTYFKSISYCYKNNIIVGRDETTFDPTGNVSVQEAITIAVRTLGYTDLAYPEGYIETAKHFGLLTNLENVNYTTPMTRGQVAQLLYNTLHNINLVGEYGKSLYDAKFSENPRKGYFEIGTLDELKANYEYRAAKYNLRDGWDSYIIDDVTFMGYTGDLQYYFEKDETDYDIYFRFTIMGEKKALGPVNQWIENPCNELTAAEAKKLLEAINLRVARFTERPLASYSSSTHKEGGPSDIYKATVDNYASLYVEYKEMDGDKYLPKVWDLNVSATTIGNIKGCILEGTIRFFGR